MKFPIQIQFRGMTHSDFIYNDVWDHAEKLDRFYDRIQSCEVVVSAPHRSKHHGKIFQTQIRLHIPGDDIFVSTAKDENSAHEDVYVAIRDAFLAARRQLEEHVRRLRGDVKFHSERSQGTETNDWILSSE